MKNEQKGKKHKRKVGGKITLSGATMVVTATPIKGESTTLAFEDSTAPVDITDVSSGYLGELSPAYKEIVTETVERSRWFGAGFKFGFEFPKIGKLEFEKKPAREIKKTEKVILVPQKK
jgi:hypothetical protein